MLIFCSTFPVIWKIGTVIFIAIHNKDLKKVGNYRPITLLIVLGKLLDKIIKSKLEEHLQVYIPNFQFDYRRKKATIFISNLQNAQLSNKKTAVFDSIWIEGILYKLFENTYHIISLK